MSSSGGASKRGRARTQERSPPTPSLLPLGLRLRKGNDAQRLAFNAYLKCWIATYSKLHNSTGTYAAIDAANAACERQFQALAVATSLSEAGSVMTQIMEAAKSGNLDNLRPPEDSSKAKPRKSDPATDWQIRPTLRSNS